MYLLVVGVCIYAARKINFCAYDLKWNEHTYIHILHHKESKTAQFAHKRERILYIQMNIYLPMHHCISYIYIESEYATRELAIKSVYMKNNSLYNIESDMYNVCICSRMYTRILRACDASFNSHDFT